MRSLLAATLVLGFAASPAMADTAFRATLAGHAILPADTAIAPPADAPADFAISGRFTATDRRRVDTVGQIPATSFLSAREAPRPTGRSLPMRGQPVQGFSGVKTMPDGTFWVTQDNGFGSQANSADAMLMAHRVRIDWQAGTVAIAETVFLHDPDRKVPFRITLEGTARRYLTGADFDLESIQPIGTSLWFGDEFGPFLIETDLSGKVIAVHETQIDGRPARSPDHFAVSVPATPDARATFTVRRSRGYEGMAHSRDGRFLYGLLEGPVWDTTNTRFEQIDGREVLRIVEFEVATGRWTGRFWHYRLEANGHAIGDFNMIDATTALIIERDNGEGDAAQACPAGQPPRTDCFNAPARFKRVYKVEMTDANAGGQVRKIGHIDLLAIADPNNRARIGATGGVFTFPFFTIENVDVVDATHIIVGNDNNYPYSTARGPNTVDANEFILLEVRDFLAAR